MLWLILVSLIWAFSFGLIKGRLTGIDPALVSFLRVGLALLVFLPWLKLRGLGRIDCLKLAGIGAVQFGLMYVCYIAAFATLKAYEVAVLTIFTPVFVCLIDAIAVRRFAWISLLAATIAVIGSGVIVMDKSPGAVSWTGVALVQASNLAFAIGQVAWRRWRRARPATEDARVFALPYLGATLATLPFALPAFAELGSITSSQWLTLAYLGLVASGAGFFLWNFGAARSHTGSLAVANNLKIPLTVACSLWIFGESADGVRLTIGGICVVGAGILAEWAGRRTKPDSRSREIAA